jgi:3'(2'), 5'-bisphosphate nucleotidase
MTLSRLILHANILIMSIALLSKYQRVSMPSYRRILATLSAKDTRQEYLLGNINDDSSNEIISLFLKAREPINYLPRLSSPANSLTWLTTRNNIVLDSTTLEMHYISGKQKLPSNDVFQLWNGTCNERLRFIDELPQDKGISKTIKIGEGGKYQPELDVAVSAVHRASYLTLYFQSKLQNRTDVISKSDDTPVTLADLATQALIIDQLMQAFPNDRFIAEEDSSVIQTDAALCNDIINLLSAVDGSFWTKERLCQTIDEGNANSTKTGRVWVLDPIDGTKGFIRGEHFCIALALLEDGIPVLSAMGCPNLSLDNVMAGKNIEAIAPDEYIGDHKVYRKSKDSGSIFFAVNNQGAYVRSLTMPLGAAVDVQVSSITSFPDATLCESAEASFGSREITSHVKNLLGIRKDYLRLDGQCKLCLVGAGAAESNLRLPPKHYLERIWDQAPGYHYIKEAGGQVTDSDGKDLDFSHGRYLSANAPGIIASNGLLHQQIIQAVKSAGY